MALGTVQALALGGRALSSYFGYRAQQKHLNWLKQFYAPEFEAKRAALPALRNLVLGYYLPRVGKPSTRLESQHLLNLEGIGREAGRGLRTSERYWRLRGNTGRGRGEQLRLRLAAERVRNQENLGYGESQEQYLSGAAGDALRGLQLLATLGQAGNAGARDLATLGLRSSGGFWDDMAQLLLDTVTREK